MTLIKIWKIYIVDKLKLAVHFSIYSKADHCVRGHGVC